MVNKTRLYAVAFVISIIAYAFIGYYIGRHETIKLLGCFSLLFAVYVWLMAKVDEVSVDHWVYASLIFRLLFLFSVPTLSDDFLRFIWDGQLMISGYHPFAHAPIYYFENNLFQNTFQRDLYEHLPKAEYFTVYPPLVQGVFWLSAKVSPNSIAGSIITLRCFNMAAEIGSLWIIKKLLLKFELPKKNILLYALNPLVIIELTGNLHHEALMIFFLLGCVYCMAYNRYTLGAISLGIAISVKLIPLIFLPLFFFRMDWRQAIKFYAVCVLMCVITFLPLLNSEFINGITTGVGYYFHTFEFNASIYYLIRELGFIFYGFNIIAMSGWKLGVASGLLIVIYSFYCSQSKSPKTFAQWPVIVPKVFMFILFIYLLFLTTLHPWYITTLVAFTIFTRYRFSVLWTFMIFLTYAGYSVSGFEENLWITFAEYLVVVGCIVYEFKAPLRELK